MQYTTGKNAERPSLTISKPTALAITAALMALLAYEVVKHNAWGMALVIVVLLVSVCLHELAHFWVARKCGVKVTEYFVGFGPRIWSTTRNGIEYGIKALPLGGYVKIIGMNTAEEVAPEDEPFTYRQASFGRKVAIVAAGPIMNIFLCLVIVWAAFAFVGIPTQQLGTQIIGFNDIGQISPAQKAGMGFGDIIQSVDGQAVQSSQQLSGIIQSHHGQAVHITVKTPSGSTKTYLVHPGLVTVNGKTQYMLGIQVDYPMVNVKQNVFVAAKDSVTRSWAVSLVEIKALGNIFSPSGFHTYAQEITNPKAQPQAGTERLSSPVGIVRAASQAQAAGPIYLLLLLAIINLSLGILNILPLPPLDGGHIAVATYERVRSRKSRRYFAKPERVVLITIAVLSVLAVASVASIYLDFVKPLPNPFG